MSTVVAKAEDHEVHMDTTEMEEVRWVPKADVLRALELANSPQSPFQGVFQNRRLGRVCIFLFLPRNLNFTLAVWMHPLRALSLLISSCCGVFNNLQILASFAAYHRA